MEYCAGGTVQERLKAVGPFGEREMKPFLRNLLSVLAYLDSRSIVHADLKPQNLMLMDSEESANFKLCDFGLAKSINDTSATATEVSGSMGYLAPEVISERTYSSKADVFAAGIIAFTLATGSHPFFAFD
jgi:serine/threonine protein kinase